VIEELEPIDEASVEGVEVNDAAACEHLDVQETTAEVIAEPPAPASSEVMLVAAAEPERADEHDGGEGVRPVVAPAQSEVVLAGTHVEMAIGDEVDAVAPLTPVFDEVVASDVPRETSSLPPAPDDPFTVLVCTLADVAIGAGSPHIASLLPGLLFDGRVPEPLDAGAAAALRAAGIWDGNAVAPAFVEVTAAWRAILRGTSDDFDACGAAMLDEWASELLARLLEAPAKAPILRQELRSRGIAAFGLAA